ncbi:AbrB/MazE/SpoVT family DNA-binding domain-containing protein [Murimonas intestini]|uniref:SpoVT-AbrB domain-containing protein n=1 Tax=Murimonas intestini TaxID=1337051 RepID=A0AB73SZX5_9FIRM|nr:AbrB/MazE/SpoVT family DNA-binding domain-containing protein [Murimonas intestini]MCR1842743.1 AbrB/MazE/SpoVT family DNA-binding domain-containing protein [Murimonas intestini]MCR1867918.1 AbrB/MazE/SpoVT family DNA-binding domain-containing protein [Murimonas intestini]MCR1885270.1 AbrB/MazE/SpoVT family DNA-binding domain-containing protein [Murimonas intestini]
MEPIKRKILFNKPGGTASKSSIMARLTLPNDFIKALNITPEDKDVIISLEGDRIIIKKA